MRDRLGWRRLSAVSLWQIKLASFVDINKRQQLCYSNRRLYSHTLWVKWIERVWLLVMLLCAVYKSKLCGKQHAQSCWGSNGSVLRQARAGLGGTATWVFQTERLLHIILSIRTCTFLRCFIVVVCSFVLVLFVSYGIILSMCVTYADCWLKQNICNVIVLCRSRHFEYVHFFTQFMDSL